MFSAHISRGARVRPRSVIFRSSPHWFRLLVTASRHGLLLTPHTPSLATATTFQWAPAFDSAAFCVLFYYCTRLLHAPWRTVYGFRYFWFQNCHPASAFISSMRSLFRTGNKPPLDRGIVWRCGRRGDWAVCHTAAATCCQKRHLPLRADVLQLLKTSALYRGAFAVPRTGHQFSTPRRRGGIEQSPLPCLAPVHFSEHSRVSAAWRFTAPVLTLHHLPPPPIRCAQPKRRGRGTVAAWHAFTATNTFTHAARLRRHLTYRTLRARSSKLLCQHTGPKTPHTKDGQTFYGCIMIEPYSGLDNDVVHSMRLVV